MTEHAQHSSFIKTPKQLIVVILLAFVVPITAIVMLVTLVTSGPTADPNALNPDAVAARIQPVGRIEFGATQAAAGTRTGEAIVKAVCATCHQTGVANAPKLANAADWAPRIKQGLNALLETATKGKGAMPPKGGDASLSDAEVARAVVYMANQAGAKFKEPAAPKEAAKPAGPQAQAQAAAPAPQPQAAAAPAPQPQAAAAPKPAAAAGKGKEVYDQTCHVCHGAGVAGAPKLGDKPAWAPRIQQGMDTLMQSALKGKNAMPPKGGNAALSDADLRAAIEFMVSQSK